MSKQLTSTVNKIVQEYGEHADDILRVAQNAGVKNADELAEIASKASDEIKMSKAYASAKGQREVIKEASSTPLLLPEKSSFAIQEEAAAKAKLDKEAAYRRYKAEKGDRLYEAEKKAEAEAKARNNRKSKAEYDAEQASTIEKQRKFEEYKREKSSRLQEQTLAEEAAAKKQNNRKTRAEYDAELETKANADAEIERRRIQSETDKANYKSQKKRQSAFDEAQHAIDKQAHGLPRRILGGVSDTGKKVLSGTWDAVSGKTRKANAAYAKEYNRLVNAAGGSADDFIDIGGAGKLGKEFDTAQDAFNASKFKQDPKMGQKGTTAPNGTDASAIAAENAKNGFSFDGIADWAKENQLIVAGGLVGGALLLTDD